MCTNQYSGSVPSSLSLSGLPCDVEESHVLLFFSHPLSGNVNITGQGPFLMLGFESGPSVHFYKIKTNDTCTSNKQLNSQLDQVSFMCLTSSAKAEYVRYCSATSWIICFLGHSQETRPILPYFLQPACGQAPNDFLLLPGLGKK